jgi:hypothetical protein
MRTLYSMLIATLMLGAGSRGVAVSAQETGPSTTGYGNVAWEELDGASIADVRSHLDVLAGTNIALTLEWKADAIDDQSRWDLVADATARGIRVQPWLTLPESQGFFPNATNYEAWISAARTLIATWRAEGLPPTTLVIDMEISKDKLKRFEELTAAADAFGVAKFLNANIDRDQYASAAKAYRVFVIDAHELGFGVNLTTLLPLLDDYADGDDFLRQGFNCPIDGDVWDEISFQVQRTLYAKSYPVTSYMVYDYGQLAQHLFGQRAGLGLGLTHAGISSDPDVLYESGDELRLDAAAAQAASFTPEHVGLYSFLGIYSRPPVSQWLQTPGPQVPANDLGTGLLHASIRAIDALDWVH